MRVIQFVVSNEVPEHPCVSPSSNCVFERRLIEKYIAENGTDPISGEQISEEQLIDIKGKFRRGCIVSKLGYSCDVLLADYIFRCDKGLKGFAWLMKEMNY